MDKGLELGDASGGRVRALIRALDRALQSVPADRADLEQRAEDARELVAALNAAGIDGESLLRYGMAPRAALPLLVGLVSGGDSGPIDLPAWRSLLRVSPSAMDADPGVAAMAIASSVHSIDSWIIYAGLEDILHFTPPTEQVLSDYEIENRERSELSLPYFWLQLRSTQEDLDRWPTEALHMEFRWRNELERSPFPEAALEFEGPDPIMLNEQIAYRAATGSDQDHDQDEALFWQLQDTAVSFLKRDRHDEAAALFEFHHRLHPEDARTLNNLGFCKLPTDAEASLDLLKRAESAGYTPVLINVYNQCCCLVRLNRLPEALDRAEFLWQRELDRDDIRSGYIWVVEAGEWHLVSNITVDLALAQLMIGVSAALGRSDRHARWQERAHAIEVEFESSEFTSAPSMEAE